MMKYFAVMLPIKDSAKSAEFRPQHLDFLEKMRNEGHVRGNGKFSDGSGGLVIYRAPSYEDCETLVRQDPYVQEGARDFNIKEWEVVWAE